jgi:dihydroneopterin aldolase
MPDAGDRIHIQELELSVRIGVPDDERAKPQRLTVSITIWPSNGFDGLKDDLTKTVNYSAVAREVHQLVSSRTDRLIETLADAIASHLLQEFPVQRVHIELRKFVLPDAKFVAAICDRRR